MGGWYLSTEYIITKKVNPSIEEDTQSDAVPSQTQQEKGKRGEKTAENIRYGEAISEHGFGGETTGSSGVANQGRQKSSSSKTCNP